MQESDLATTVEQPISPPTC